MAISRQLPRMQRVVRQRWAVRCGNRRRLTRASGRPANSGVVLGWAVLAKLGTARKSVVSFPRAAEAVVSGEKGPGFVNFVCFGKWSRLTRGSSRLPTTRRVCGSSPRCAGVAGARSGTVHKPVIQFYRETSRSFLRGFVWEKTQADGSWWHSLSNRTQRHEATIVYRG